MFLYVTKNTLTNAISKDWVKQNKVKDIIIKW